MNQKFKNILKSLGPGLLFAGAAIGGSHLVQSTRAGANYGFILAWVILFANFLKYPFFEYGHRYAAVTGKSLLEGYKELGNWVLYLFFFLNLLMTIINTAAVTMVTASLAGNVIGLGLSISQWSIILFILTVLILFAGSYKWLDKIVKVIIVTLAISTIVAVTMAAIKGSQAAPGFQTPTLFNLAGMSFLVALLGWMPAPIEGSVWSSLWLLERKKETGHTPTREEATLDFQIGYIGTAILAVGFLSLGALVMHGTGEAFSPSGIKFAGQVIALYVKTLGEWSLPIISIAALSTMLSTTLTVVDAYPRSLSGCISLLFPKYKGKNEVTYKVWVLLNVLISFCVIAFLAKNMKAMIDFATIASFIAAPIFAFLNYKVVTHKHFNQKYAPSLNMRVLSWAGIFFLSTITIIFLIWRFFLS